VFNGYCLSISGGDEGFLAGCALMVIVFGVVG